MVNITSCSHVITVRSALLDEMAAVGCGIDEDIVGLCFHTSFDDCLQVFVLDLEVLKGKVVHVNDKLVITGLDLGNHIGKILELVLVDLDETEALRIELVECRLDSGGLSCSGITVKQHIVCTFTLDKIPGIVEDLLLLKLVTHQIIVVHSIKVVYGNELRSTVMVIPDAESLVETEHTHTMLMIILTYSIIKIIRSLRCQKFILKLIYGPGNVAEIHALMFFYCVIILKCCETVGTEHSLKL